MNEFPERFQFLEEFKVSKEFQFLLGKLNFRRLLRSRGRPFKPFQSEPSGKKDDTATCSHSRQGADRKRGHSIPPPRTFARSGEVSFYGMG